ncbi:hypothetical protein EMIT051CA3_20192 [Pseudomonas chlororaphis]
MSGLVEVMGFSEGRRARMAGGRRATGSELTVKVKVDFKSIDKNGMLRSVHDVIQRRSRRAQCPGGRRG